jgi:adenine-specific DNA-methyltransferase
MISNFKPLEAEAALAPRNDERRQELGQFFTPGPVADFMASLFDANWDELDLLDAGAGGGALSEALVKRLCTARRKPRRISISAYELDETVIESLRTTLQECQRKCSRAGIQFSSTIFNEDFIVAAVATLRADLFAPPSPRFNAAIVNPPYRKIRSGSDARLLLRAAGIETSNLYTGFVALVTRLLTVRGELVAITPRSFCNGPYFKPFRKDFLDKMSLRRLHVFESRSVAFKRDAVLQENIISHAVKCAFKPEYVCISASSGAPGASVKERNVAYNDVVPPFDKQKFIHVAGSDEQEDARVAMRHFSASLLDLGLSVSTGRVVDFRAKEFLRQQPASGTVPLIYPSHFNTGFVHWPKERSRKPNAIVSNALTRELLVPAGAYVLLKRFTTKEERKRIVACIYDPHQIHAPLVGFENHLNYFHVNGHGLTMNLAKGLAAFLNTTVVDQYFRQFNGHTQVNAADLRSLNYPSKAELENLGRKVASPGMPQEELDAAVGEELF